MLAPFRAQLRAVRSALDRAGADAQVSTIDRFQGKDAACVVLSFTRAAGGGLGDLLADPRRLNVALSRARLKLVLVGCREVLVAGSPVIARLVARLEDEGGVCRVDDVE